MDDILAHLEAALWSFLGKAADFCLELVNAAGRKALELLAALAVRFDGWAAKVAAVPLWLSVSVGLLLVALTVCYLLRQRLYDRVLVYHLVWLRRGGYARQVFQVRRGAVRETRQAMARRVPLPERFAAIDLYEVEPDRYGVAYGPAAGVVEDVRFYRRDLRAGLRVMAEDVAAYYRANVRLLHVDSELRALFAVLDAFDPAFAVCRPRLPGEATQKAVPGRSPETARSVARREATASTGDA